MSGLNDDGFELKTFEEIINQKEAAYVAAFGDINLEPESVVGQTIGISSAPIAELWLSALDTFNAQFIDTATGISLDYTALAINITRLRATATRVNAIVTVANNTLLPQGVEARATTTDTVFRSDEQITINSLACIDSTVTINNNTEASYTITIDGTPFEYTPFIIDQIPQIVDGLLFLINSSALSVTALPVGDDGIYMSSDTGVEISVTVSTGISITSVSSNLGFTSSILGNIAVPSNTLDVIITPIIGWISLNNPTAGSSGRDVETDNELRARYKESFRLGGSGTAEAIRANLRNIEGVIVANVQENKSMVTVGLLPAKSYACTILGGAAEDIGAVLLAKAPAGIESFGDTSVVVKDSEGTDQIFYFSRPTPIYIYTKVTITLDSSNTYPVNGDEVISQGILDIIKLLNVGDDVIYQSLFVAVFAVSGIQSAIVEIGGTVDEFVTPALSSANVSIASSETAVSDLSKIEIVVV